VASSMDAVTLDPWHEPGIPLDEQYRSWKQRIEAPYAAPMDKRSLSDGAKLPSAQETPASRTSPG
jgi:hypothetical protein